MATESGTSFSSPEDMLEAYNQMWQDIADGFTDIPDYFKQALDFASINPVAIIVVSLFLTMFAFFLIRIFISDFGGRSR